MKPTECPQCQPYFTPVLEAETRMELVKAGPSAAKALVNKKLEGIHAEHSQEE